ncbi:MAG: arginine--tRNA ligase [Candidatus Kerfeldbacteria bacterium]|nr:arginine--tRNA ligase [Candidatus Kerfeldbacteria bacterium]
MIEHELQKLFQHAVKKLGELPEQVSVELEHPAASEHGDYASNIAMKLCKSLKRSPMDIAREIADTIPASPFIKKIDVAAPGFINLWLSDAFLWSEVQRVLEQGEQYGAPVAPQPERILIEHTQVNPNKAPHIGHLRNACIGDSIAKLYASARHDAKVLYYQNDVGQQIATVVLAAQKQFVKREDFSSLIAWASAAYADIEKRMETDETLKNEKQNVQLKIAAQNTEEAKFARKLTDEILCETLQTFSNLDIAYDLVVRESDILKAKLWEKTFELLKTKKEFYQATDGERKGCWLVKIPGAEDKIIVRSNGIPTYTGNDIAYHLWKFGVLEDFCYFQLDWKTQSQPLFVTSSDAGEERTDFAPADQIVNVVDQTQTYPLQSVVESLRVLGYENHANNYHHVNYGFVYLSRQTAENLGIALENGATQVKMSGRKGTVVSVSDFLHKVEENLRAKYGDFENIRDVRNGAIKFELLKYNTYQDIVFDLEAALNPNGFSGPYLQYAYTRAASILNKAGERKRSATETPQDMTAELPVLRMMVRFPEVVAATLYVRAPHLLCLYLFELAQTFNLFYNEHRILESDHEAQWLTLTRAFQHVLKNGLTLLGIPAPEKM